MIDYMLAFIILFLAYVSLALISCANHQNTVDEDHYYLDDKSYQHKQEEE